jgi:hypothetical protein
VQLVDNLVFAPSDRSAATTPDGVTDDDASCAKEGDGSIAIRDGVDTAMTAAAAPPRDRADAASRGAPPSAAAAGEEGGMSCTRVASAFARLDGDADGELDPDEVKARRGGEATIAMVGGMARGRWGCPWCQGEGLPTGNVPRS